MRYRVILKPNGQGFIEGYSPKLPPQLQVSAQQRATHILPATKFYRLCFRIIRFLFGGCGKVAAWTRTWKGPWIIDFTPLTPSRVEGPFSTYSEAVDYEYAAVLQILLNRQS